MARPMRGERYLEICKDKPFGDYVLDVLPYLDYEEARRFYAKAEAPGAMSDAHWAFLGCNDRYFLLTAILGRKDAYHPWLYDRAREVEAEPDDCLDLWSRDHYKSTIITYSGIIQEVLANPELTVGIFSHTKKIASKFLFQIKQSFEQNEDLKRIYADVLWAEPAKEAPMWSIDGGLIVRRETNPKESTIEAHGLVAGQPTSKHFKLRVYDDVVTRESVTTPEMIKTTTEAWELSDNLGSAGGRKWHIGTRYHFGDTYAEILKTNIFKPRLYPATDNGKLDGNPVFLTPEAWAEKKLIQTSTVAAQMLQNPLGGKEQMFSPTWFRPYTARPKTLNVYIMGDPSRGVRPTSDNTAIAVVGIDVNGNKYLLDGFRHRMQTSERWEALSLLYKKWQRAPGVQILRVGWERYGQQADGEYFEERMRAEGFSFELEELNWTRDGQQSKKHRVERLEPDFRNSRFFLPAQIWVAGEAEQRPCLWTVDADKNKLEFRPLLGPTREMLALEAQTESYRIIKPIVRRDEDGNPYDLTRALMEEMMFFPFAQRDDLVDATSRIYDMQPVPPSVHELPGAISAREAEFVDA